MAGIEVAAMWSREIVSAIRECKVLLLSISPHSTESENVVKELALASERKKTIIPIYLEPAEIPETMEYQLAGIQRVEFFEGREDLALQAVIRALSKLGVTVADEASAAAAAAASNIAAHGAGHSSRQSRNQARSRRLAQGCRHSCRPCCAWHGWDILFRQQYNDRANAYCG